MPTRDGVACAGNWIVEHIHTAPSYPKEGSLARIGEAQRTFGGCAYHVIRNLHDLDPDMFLYAIGAIGDDEAGRDLLSDLHRRDIDTFQLVPHADIATAHAEVIVSEASGRRTSFYSAGANRLLSPALFDFSQCLAKWLHLGSLLLLDGLDASDAEFGTGAARVLHDAKEAGLTTSIDLITDDAADDAAIISPSLPYTDYLMMNATQAAACCGVPLSKPPKHAQQELRACAHALLEKGVQQAVVIHFPEGALAAARNGECISSPSLHLSEDQIRNHDGAGDAFSAAFIYATIRNWGYEKRLQLGHCCAAQKLIDAGRKLSAGDANLELSERFSFREGD